MSYLVFRIENALNEILSFDVVDCHGVFYDVSGVDDELLGVGHHAEEGKVYDGEKDVVAIDLFYLFPVLVVRSATTW